MDSRPYKLNCDSGGHFPCLPLSPPRQPPGSPASPRHTRKHLLGPQLMSSLRLWAELRRWGRPMTPLLDDALFSPTPPCGRPVHLSNPLLFRLPCATFSSTSQASFCGTQSRSLACRSALPKGWATSQLSTAGSPSST